MHKNLIFVFFLIASIMDLKAQAYEYTIVTSIESVVPMGIGRSRIISSEEEINYENFTTSRTEDSKKQNKSKRSDAKVSNFDETKIVPAGSYSNTKGCSDQINLPLFESKRGCTWFHAVLPYKSILNG